MILSRIVPAHKRDDSDVQQWQLPQFDSNTDHSTLSRGTSATNADPEFGPDSTHESGAADSAVADSETAAHERGYQEGLRLAEQENALQIEQLNSMITALQNPSQALTEAVASELLDLAAEISRQILSAELAARPEQMATIIETALSRLPAGSQETIIALNSQDAQVMENALPTLGGTEIKLTIDPMLDNGNFVLKRSQSIIHGGIDAMLQSVVSQLKSE